MVFGLGNKEIKVQGLNTNETPVYKFDGKVGEFMRKQKINYVITNSRLLVVHDEKIDEKYELTQVTVLVANLASGMLTTGVMAGKQMQTGKLRFLVNGSPIGETTNMHNPTETANNIREVINGVKSMQYEGKNQQNTDNSSQENPLKILSIRYAKGEITKGEFEEMKKMLE